MLEIMRHLAPRPTTQHRFSAFQLSNASFISLPCAHSESRHASVARLFDKALACTSGGLSGQLDFDRHLSFAIRHEITQIVLVSVFLAVRPEGAADRVQPALQVPKNAALPGSHDVTAPPPGSAPKCLRRPRRSGPPGRCRARPKKALTTAEACRPQRRCR